MITPSFWNEAPSQFWTATLVNHLWQSTVAALAAWLVALTLRSNPARIRYWVWMIASMKFLIPFSLFVSAGEWLRSATASPVERPALAAVMAQIAQPFPQAQVFPAAGVATASHPADLMARILFSLWACGSLTAAFLWLRKWRQISAAMRAASPRTLAVGVPVFCTSSLLEPGVFGILRPVLLLPEGIMDRLTAAQLDAIVAHEMCHVRRRDNLTFALHMVVETLFWFHPLVWWIRARLVEERELACDEAVLQSGNKAEVYAEGILNVCKFYVESPLACVSGVSGSDLKKRIVRIMTGKAALRLGFSRKLLLGLAGLLAVAAPVAFGLIHEQQISAAPQPDDTAAKLPAFEVASIKPNKSGEMRMGIRFKPDGITMEGVTPQLILTQAFHVEDDRIVGAPSWVQSDRFDIEAKVAPEDAPKLDKLKPVQRMEMLQPLLEDRFSLKFHHETREMPVYVLEVAKGGSKLKQAEPEGADGNGGRSMPKMMMWIGNLKANGAQMDMLVRGLSGQVGRTIIDKTGLTGKYDFNLHFTPENMPPSGPGPGPGPDGGHSGGDAPPPTDTTGPDIFTAVQEQLGLKLVPEKGPVDVVVIDHIDRPSPN
jgi:uncharacterized protein (TIGR03435 family)